ncbi:hypothetical protein [Fontivita pretiosa]|uniref:hypothetical protein n=1 Tax=Fontivita pretiosa TaxID=2989684 RepID=UPI003D1635F8
MIWNKQRILGQLRKLHRMGRNISYSNLARSHPSLLSAAAYHFGSYRAAVEKAGIDYAEVSQRPRWTRQRIIALIKQARRDGQDLHWGAVIRRGDQLSRAAFAAVQPRLFGSWVRALHAAGLDADQISLYRSWNRDLIVFELRARAQQREAMNSGALQRDDPGLHAAAIRHFGSYDQALRAARLDPAVHRQRRRWTRQLVISALKHAARNGEHLSDTAVRRGHSALYGAAIRLFGTFTAARRAAGVKLLQHARRKRTDP